MPSGKELYEPIARQIAENHDIDVEIFLALINQESKWDPHARNGESVGIGQIIPKWHPECGNVADPNEGLRCAAVILQTVLRSFGGSYEWALVAYHHGPNGARSFGPVIPDFEMTTYVRPILNDAVRMRMATPVRPVISEPSPTPTPSPACLMATPTPTQFVATQTPVPPLSCVPTGIDATPTPTPVLTLLLALPLIWAALNR